QGNAKVGRTHELSPRVPAHDEPSSCARHCHDSPDGPPSGRTLAVIRSRAQVAPRFRLACTVTPRCTSEPKPLLLVTTMTPAADCAVPVMLADRSNVPASTVIVPPLPPVPPVAPLPTPPLPSPPLPTPPVPPAPSPPLPPAAPTAPSPAVALP